MHTGVEATGKMRSLSRTPASKQLNSAARDGLAGRVGQELHLADAHFLCAAAKRDCKGGVLQEEGPDPLHVPIRVQPAANGGRGARDRGQGVQHGPVKLEVL